MSEIVSIHSSYFLPDKVLNLSGQDAAYFYQISNQLIGLYQSYGYECIIPPIWEFDDAICFDCPDLSKKTIKMVDQYSARMLSFRSDNTLQAIRMYGNQVDQFPIRLCYANQIFHNTVDALSDNRHPFQVGVELLGSDSVLAFNEIVELALFSFQKSGLFSPHVVINHTNWLSVLSHYFKFDYDQKQMFMRCVKRCEFSGIEKLIKFIDWKKLGHDMISPEYFFELLLKQDIDLSDLAIFEDFFRKDAMVLKMLFDFKVLLKKLKKKIPNIHFVISFSDSASYSYHHGMIFSMYHKGFSLPVIQGGQYQFQNFTLPNTKQYFGMGFSLDLFSIIAQCTEVQQKTQPRRIWLPVSEMTDALKDMVGHLRENKDVVIFALDQNDDPFQSGCSYFLKYQNHQWQVLPIKNKMNKQ